MARGFGPLRIRGPVWPLWRQLKMEVPHRRQSREVRRDAGIVTTFSPLFVGSDLKYSRNNQ